ncbi:MAG: orotidine-5'-phosphate decarboxylase [Lachnospiraceae bacterium]|nr:orotidine-5'-phosphate decarboxylase [Lachnospiraceae bacterium]
MIDRLIEEIKKKDAPIVAGLDPTLKMVPAYIKQKAFSEYGKTLKGASEAMWEFNKGIIDAIYDLVPAVKPQIAMYEQYGTEGVIVFKRTIDYCKEKGLIVIGDIKRADIGSSSQAYAVGHLGKVDVDGEILPVFDEDFVTVNPYLGSDGIKPFIDACEKEDKGIFILVKTSNPGSGEFQDQPLLNKNSRPLYESVGEMVDALGKGLVHGGYSEIGAVVGATYPEIGKILRDIMPKSYILVPGYGAQGGRGSDLKYFFNKDGLGAIINSSRGIIAAYMSDDYPQYTDENYADAARAAVLNMKEDLRANI